VSRLLGRSVHKLWSLGPQHKLQIRVGRSIVLLEHRFDVITKQRRLRLISAFRPIFILELRNIEHSLDARVDFIGKLFLFLVEHIPDLVFDLVLDKVSGRLSFHVVDIAVRDLVANYRRDVRRPALESSRG